MSPAAVGTSSPGTCTLPHVLPQSLGKSVCTLPLCRNIYHIVAKECPSVVHLTCASTCTCLSIIYMYTHNCMCNVLNKHSTSTLFWGIVPRHILTLHLLEPVMCAYDCMGTVYMYSMFSSTYICMCMHLSPCTCIHVYVCAFLCM